MPELWPSKKALIGTTYVIGVQLGEKTAAPNLKWPVRPLPSTSRAVDRSSFAPKEQRLSRDLVTLAPLVNDTTIDPDLSTWGWFGDSGWFRSSSLVDYNARIQESVGTLAWFYTHDRPWNPYYGNQILAERLLASLRYYLGLQYPDGGFGTAPTEAGPATTGFGLGHLALLYLNLEDTPLKLAGWDDYWKKRTHDAIIKAADWVLDETNDRSWVAGAFHSNQLVGGVAGAARIYDLLPPNLKIKFNEGVARLSTHIVSSVGYMYENYGPDFGYTLGTGLPYLGYLYEVTQDAGIASLAQKTFDFFSYNYLLEPAGVGFIVNDPVSTRTRALTLEHSRSDEVAFDSMGVIRTAAPKANAFMTTQESKNTYRANWASSAAQVTQVPKGSFSPHRIHRATDSESFPTTAERDAALAALPYNASTGFTEYRHDDRTGDERFNRHYLYVRRPGYYTNFHWGYRADGVRVGSNFFYHPQTGTFIMGQGDSRINWGLYTAAGGYSDTLVTTYSTTSTIPTGATNFTLAMGVSTGASSRTVNYVNSGITMSVVRSGLFTERIPLMLWPGSGSQTADVITFTLEGGTSRVVSDATDTAVVTAITVTRAGRGVLTITLDSPRTVTIPSVAETNASTVFSATVRAIRQLDIEASGNLSYSVAITTL